MLKKWLPGMPPPPWSGNNDAMRDWVFYQLENFYRAQREKLLLEDRHEALLLEGTYLKELIKPEALEEAKSGDVTTLRQFVSWQLGPEFKDFIHPKPLTRGKKYPRRLKYSSSKHHYGKKSRVRMAKLAVPIIQNFWRENYGGKFYRTSGDIDAYEIAGLYYRIAEEDVRRKPPGRRKKPRAKDK